MNQSISKFGKDLNILYVEDEPMVRQVTLAMLNKYFKNITTAENGSEGLKLYEKGNFDIIFTDITMPVLSGTEMVEKIKKVDNEQIIIALSGESDAKEIIKLIDLDIDFFIAKPIEKEVLEHKVARAIRSFAVNRLDDDYSEKLYNKMKEKELKLFKEYRIIQQELKGKREVLDFIIDSTDEGHGIMDGKGNFKLISDVYTSIFGYTKRELQRLSCFDITDDTYKDMTKFVLQYGKEVGEVHNFVKVCIAKDGESKTISMSLKSMYNGEAFYVLIKEISHPTVKELENSHIPFSPTKIEKRAKDTDTAEDFIERSVDINEKINKFEMIDEEFELVINRIQQNNTKEAAELLYKLADIISSLQEFGRVYDALLELANGLSQAQDIESADHLRDLLFGISDDIFQWRKGMFVEKDLEDIHFFDDSIISNCIQTKNYLSHQEDDSELELF
ncbi:MAG: response regulator [Campylobacterales bacterium]|nr:response regulator [Campylobacterales bacterium]